MEISDFKLVAMKVAVYSMVLHSPSEFDLLELY